MFKVFHAIPAVEPLYSNFEKNYDPEPLLDYMKSLNYNVPIIAVVLYLIFCYYGSILMKDVKPFKLDKSLAAWNLFLSLFSGYGMIRMVPHTLFLMSTKTMEETICDPGILFYYTPSLLGPLTTLILHPVFQLTSHMVAAQSVLRCNYFAFRKSRNWLTPFSLF